MGLKKTDLKKEVVHIEDPNLWPHHYEGYVRALQKAWFSDLLTRLWSSQRLELINIYARQLYCTDQPQSPHDRHNPIAGGRHFFEEQASCQGCRTKHDP